MSGGKETETETETEKRKQEENDAVSKNQKRKRASDDGEETDVTVTDAEVEEFFAIIRRMQVAVNYIKNGNGNGNGDGRDLTERSVLLEWESNGVKGEVKRREENVGLDLNADPGPEEDSV